MVKLQFHLFPTLHTRESIELTEIWHKDIAPDSKIKIDSM